MMSMKKTVVLFVTSVVTVGLGSRTALAQMPPATQASPAASTPKPSALGLAVYPGSGQDATQQGKDEGECYAWARQQTGIDPTPAPTPAAAAEAPRGGAVKTVAPSATSRTAAAASGTLLFMRPSGSGED